MCQEKKYTEKVFFYASRKKSVSNREKSILNLYQVVRNPFFLKNPWYRPSKIMRGWRMVFSWPYEILFAWLDAYRAWVSGLFFVRDFDIKDGAIAGASVWA